MTEHVTGLEGVPSQARKKAYRQALITCQSPSFVAKGLGS